jgi:hypothetical protein
VHHEACNVVTLGNRILNLVVRVSEEHQVRPRPHLDVKVGLEIAVEEIGTDFPTVIVLVAEHAARGKNREPHASSFQLSDHFPLDFFAIYDVGVKLHVPGCAGPVGQEIQIHLVDEYKLMLSCADENGLCGFCLPFHQGEDFASAARLTLVCRLFRRSVGKCLCTRCINGRAALEKHCRKASRGTHYGSTAFVCRKTLCAGRFVRGGQQ